jgi:hypothetical protein
MWPENCGDADQIKLRFTKEDCVSCLIIQKTTDYPFLIHFSKHIGLFLLLVFSGSFVTETATAAYSLFHLSGVQMPAAGESVYCKSGFIQSGDVVYAPREIDHEQDETPDRNSNALLTSNCHSSLQLMSSDSPELKSPLSKTLLNSDVLLLSAQLYVHQIADPPRIG